jgi:hypothetical protein
VYKSEYFKHLRETRGLTESEAVKQMASQYERRKVEEIENLRAEIGLPRKPTRRVGAA